MLRKKVYKYKLNKLSFISLKIFKLYFGNYGIKSLSSGLITKKHLENLRRKLSKQFKRLNSIVKSKLYIRLALWKPFTSKPLLSRMGKGAGNISKWFSLIKTGAILLEILTTELLFSVEKIFKKSSVFFPLRLTLIKQK